MVQSGILRAFGPDLRRFLSKGLDNRLAAFAAGLGATAILQSSTAAGLIVASFCASGALELVPALAVMLAPMSAQPLFSCVMSVVMMQSLPSDASKANVAHGGVDRLCVPSGGAISAAIAWGAEV
jgi:hypothetical protein